MVKAKAPDAPPLAPPKKASGKGKGKLPPTGAPLPPRPLLPPPAAPPPPPVPKAFDFVVPAKHAPKAKAKAKAKAARADPRAFLPAIEGGEAYYDEYPNAETGRLYQNWIFRCPHHAGCQRVRGCHAANIRNHGFLEPIAFLHAWRDTPPGPNGHRLTQPPAAAVTTFFTNHQAELADLHAHFATGP